MDPDPLTPPNSDEPPPRGRPSRRKPKVRRHVLRPRARRTLSDREVRFVEAYLTPAPPGVDERAHQCYALRCAGYKVGVGSGRLAKGLLNRPHIAAEVERVRERALRRAQYSRERHIERLREVAEGDPRAVAEWGPDGVRLNPSGGLTEGQARMVKRVRGRRRVTTDDEGRETIETTAEVDLHNPLDATDQLAKLHGWYAPQAVDIRAQLQLTFNPAAVDAMSDQELQDDLNRRLNLTASN